MNKDKKQLLLILLTSLLINIIIFREWIFLKKVPVAFDYGVYNYQPWKIDHQENFSTPPKPMGHDDIRIFYPQRQFITRTIKSGHLPFWNPHEFAGNVSLANSQTAVFYPPFLLFLFFPQLIAWSILSFSIPIVAGLGTYLFLKLLVKNKYAAIFGALVFAFSSAILTRTQDGLVAGHSLIWLPWVLCGIELILKKYKVKGLIVTLIALILSLLAGWFQFSFYVYASGLTYALFKLNKATTKARKNNLFLLILLVFLFSLLLTAFHWLPSFEAYRFSPRGILGTPEEFKTQHLMPVSHLITLIIPHFFGHPASFNYYSTSEYKEGAFAIGAIPFVLALVGLMFALKEKKSRFFIYLLLASLILGLKNPISQFFLSLKIPIIASFLPNRILVLSSFSLSVFSAYGLKTVLENNRNYLNKIIKIALILMILGFLSVAGIYFYEKFIVGFQGQFSLFEKGLERYIRISTKESILPLIFILLLYFVNKISPKKNNWKLITLIFLLTLIGQIARADRSLYFSEPEHEFPDSPIIEFLKENTRDNSSRFISLSYSRITSNIPTYYELYFPEGVDAMYPIWYGEFADFYEGEELSTDDVLRIEATYSEELERRRWLDPKTINLLSHLGIRYIIIPKDADHIIPPEPYFKKVCSHKWHVVYEYQYAFPRTYFVSNHTLSNYKTVTLQRIYHPLFFKNQEVVLAGNPNRIDEQLEADDNQVNSNFDLIQKQRLAALEIRKNPFFGIEELFADFSNNPIKISYQEPNQIILEADVQKDGYVVISDSYFPGWKAQVDGVEATLYRANHAFMAVPVEKGKHRIVLSYQPASFILGEKIALTAFIFGGISLFAYQIMIKKQPKL